MATALKKSTTHVVLRDAQTPGQYYVWTEHKSEKAAADICRAIGKNGGQGHTVVASLEEMTKYTLV